MCDGRIQGTFASKFKGCCLCDFFGTIKQDEGKDLMKPPALLEIIAEESDMSPK
jgi:hypothetical protein